jgi:beta-galactosidase
LNDAVHQFDPTRPTTVCCNYYPECIDTKFAFYADILGLNYKPHAYSEIKEKYPDMLLIGSETASCVSTRGVYDLPAAINIGDPRNKELTISDYGLCAPAWAYYAERELAAQEDCEYVMGEFIWTGFDYLGEPTPYYTEWPSRSSYFGVIDLAGLPKNRYYCYKAAWTDEPTLHIFPHWNWEGYEGKNVPVHVYTNYDEVELFVNGISQGKKRRASEGNSISAQLERFRLIWNDTVYEQGEVCAIAYQNGIEKERKILRTASEPYRIELSAYSKVIAADGESLNYVTAKILDKDGNLCPKATNRLTFSTEGSAFVYATDAGDQRETESFLRPDKKALSGMLVCCLRSNGNKGSATVLCSAEGLISGTVSFECI